MIAGVVILYIWAAVALVIAVLAAYGSIRLLFKAKKYAKMQEDLVKKVEVRTKNKYNAIATLPQKEFGEYLAIAYGKMLELKSASQISERDPVAEQKLALEAEAALIDYLGPETIEAIEYYYGKGYIHRWTRYTYMLLSKRGMTGQIIRKEMQYETAARNTI